MKKNNIIAIVAIVILVAFVYFMLNIGSDNKPSPSLLADPDVIWRGDAESGDLSQWCRVNQAAPGRISVVTSPVKQGQYAYKFILNNGDSVYSTERVTLSQQCDGRYETDGQEKYYGFSVLLPSDYPTNTGWSLVVQWKGIHTGSPPISLNLRNDRWMLNYRPNVNSGELHKWDAPVVKGQWANFVLHVKWSANPAVGFIEMWYNGVLVVPKFATSTMHTNGSLPINNYVAMGLYRDASISTNVILYHDGMVVGRTYESVTGEQPPIVTSTPPTITRTPTATRTPIASRTPTRTLAPTATFTVTPTGTPESRCDPAYLPFICIYRLP